MIKKIVKISRLSRYSNFDKKYGANRVFSNLTLGYLKQRFIKFQSLGAQCEAISLELVKQ